MDASQRAFADALLVQALELSVADRPAFLDAECGNDPELRRRVERLLEAAEEEGETLDYGRRAVEALRAEARDEEGALSTGARVGVWRIVRELARGGMAVVYLAERADEEFRQLAALKVLKRGTDTDEIRRRFVRERQILAALQHPNIAQLLDGGVMEDGRAYLVMEYVDGRPVDRFCAEERLDVEGRLRLFGVVVRTVQYAHRNLVVHRDLKPSNVLVTRDGVVKLLDFGIAKLLDTASVLHGAAPTRTSLRFMTPQWATPEQVRGGPITTGTDVYQLGLLLYRLLTGAFPYRFDGETPAEVERVIAETPPTRPSTALRQAQRDPTGTGSGEGRVEAVDPPPIEKLPRDLDLIALTALEKEPERRYSSAEALVEDVERFLDGRPILARPPTVRYRLGRFVRRHRWAAASAGLLSLALLAGGGGTLWQARRAAREAARAKAVKDYLVELFRAADPLAEPDPSLTVRQLLDRGADKLSGRWVDDPEVRAEVLAVVGETYIELGALDRAAGLLEEALELRESTLGPEDPLIAESLTALATCQAYRGRWAEARPLLERVLEIRRGRPPAAPLGETLSDLCTTYVNLGLFDLSGGICAEAVELLRSVAGVPPETLATAIDHQAKYHRSQGDLATAEALLRDSQRITEEALGAESPLTALRLNNLSTVLYDQDRWEEAAELQRRALGIFEHALGPDHHRVALALSNLGASLNELGELEEAAAVVERSVEIRRRGAPGSPALAWSLSNLAYIYKDLGRDDEAEALFRRASAIREEVLGPDHPDLAQSLAGLAWLLRLRGDFDEAEVHYRRCLEIYEAIFGADSPRVIGSVLGLARVAVGRERWEEADAGFERAVAIRRAEEGGSPAALQRLLREWAATYRTRGLLERAGELEAEATELTP